MKENVQMSTKKKKKNKKTFNINKMIFELIRLSYLLQLLKAHNLCPTESNEVRQKLKRLGQN